MLNDATEGGMGNSSENPPYQGGVGVLRLSSTMFATGHPPCTPSKGEQFSFIGGAAAGMDGSLEFLAVPSTY